ncbi:MAG TPA: PHP domain-containing protein [bacterium]|nr:PHP domain-containing protein [bacterium]
MKKTSWNGTAALVLCAIALSLSGCYVDASLFKKPVALEAGAGAPERTPKYEHAGWTIARASLHNHTIYSDGKRTPEDLLELARRQGMAILAITDHREGEIKMDGVLRAQAGGVEKVGYEAYYQRLGQVQAAARGEDMIVIKGVEVSPPYLYNAGKFPALVIAGQYNHFTVYDVPDPAVLAAMPVSHEINFRPEPSPGDTPYQQFVDYIADHGGIVHAVHAESAQDEWIGTTHVLTPAPVKNLHLKHLTGFSITPEGWHQKAGGPGGLWDTDLIEYLAGMRERPVWANGDADYHGPHGSLATSTTLFYMREFSEDEIYRCMRQGRMVALQGDAFQDTYVAEWWVSGGGRPGNPVMLGEEIEVKAAPVVRFALDHPVAGTRTRLVRNGVVIHEEQGSELSYTDIEQGEKKAPAYYRVEVIGPRNESEKSYESATEPDSVLFVNPIFVRFRD